MQDNHELMAIQCAQQGDQQAWAYLFELHFTPVYSFCLKLAQGTNQIAEEVAQETFMTAARRLHRYQPTKSELRFWLFGIARNRHKKLATASARRRQREYRYRRPPHETPQDQEHTAVIEILAQMNSQDRDLLQAKYLETRTIQEIAHACQITEHAAESRLRRARDRFAVAYEKHIKQA